MTASEAVHLMVVDRTDKKLPGPSSDPMHDPSILGACRHCGRRLFGKWRNGAWTWFNWDDSYAHIHHQGRRRHG